MAAFATAADLEVRWRPLTAAEALVADARLVDASAVIRLEAPTIDDRIAADEIDAALPRLVACEMVKRSMLSGLTGAGVAQTQQTAGPFSQSQTFANPTGNLYLTKQERRLLGVGNQTAFTINTGPFEDFAAEPINSWEIG